MTDQISKIKLVPLGQEHEKLLLDWRTDPSVASMMSDKSVISAKSHKKWLDLQLTRRDSTSCIRIATVNSKPLGVISFKKHNENAWEWGFYKAPMAISGTGLTICTAGIAWADCFLNPRPKCLIAKVLDTNQRSINLHEKLGFSRISTTSWTALTTLVAQDHHVFFSLDLTYQGGTSDFLN